MIDIDKWREILNSIQRHPLRTMLTALGVFWGIFMLVILLGAGQGLQNGVEYQFRDDAVNSMWIRRGVTSMPYNGLPKGRRIQFTNEDYDMLSTQFDGVEHVTGRYYLSGDQVTVYKDKRLSFNTRAVHPGHRYLENTIVEAGRYINEADLASNRKVAVIGRIVRQDLFGEEDPIGEPITIGGIVYRVVGTYSDTGSDNEMRIIYIPITTAQKVYAGTDEVHQLMLTTDGLDLEQTKELEQEVRAAFAGKHEFDIADRRAVSIFSAAEEFQQFQSLFGAIRAFVWFVGIGSIIAGVIGISNIMLIVVKDRTKEIGVRKALGATPTAIISMILQEAILITAVAGYMGLLAGVGVISLMESLEVDYFRNPEVNLSVAVTATIVLVIAGALAGYMPARQAARINPIEAMKS
ncbi:ABC transporter permease [Phaeodactylibacter luteus]|uniref:ABC transporter permease n=1 Tax=Phaeodactylibacter luteus TaxID=1564516 RepID=A0A5C6S1G7_9BACT|nr:ABC transporter permease [Phaeodactylibacter luteus]TXB68391.1 ABC transporter permease [Phaeodactylibacter luteus]